MNQTAEVASDTNKKDKRLEKALERYKDCEDSWSENRRLAKEDMRFRAGEQWPDKIKTDRGDDRPTLVVDKLSQYVRQVVNDGRQNRPDVKVRPIDDSGDDEIAKALQGLIRHIHNRSNADQAFDTALDSAVTCGFGYFRVLTEYASDGTANQEILVSRIRNPLSVLLGPHQKADGSDTKYGFIVEDIPKDEFSEKWPKAKFVDWQTDGMHYADGWTAEKTVRVCEYFYKETIPANVHILADGTTCPEDDYQRAVSEGVQPPAILETRNIPTVKVSWLRMTGAEILEETPWLGKYIPIIPVYGNEFDIDGRVIYSGLIRPAMDAQRLYNYSRSAYAERVALAPKAPYIAAAEQVDEFPEWKTANTRNHSVLRYKPINTDQGQAVPPPQRQQASDIPEGFARDMAISEHDIQAAMGMYNASIGQQGNERSGKAILARQREGDTATYHYLDNLSRAIAYLGRIEVDLAPKIYDSRRVIRILGEDGSTDYAEIDPEQDRPVERMGGKVIYNLNVGTYDVTITSGPSYNTKRMESAEAMIQITQANPEAWNTHGDLIAKAQDWPAAEEWAERSKLFLPPHVQEAIQKSKSMSPEVQAVVAQSKQAIQQRDQQIQEMGQALQQAQQKQLEMEAKLAVQTGRAAEDGAQAAVNEAKAELELIAKEIELLKAQKELIDSQRPESGNESEMVMTENGPIPFEQWKVLVDSSTKILLKEMETKAAAKQAAMSANAKGDGSTVTNEDGTQSGSPALQSLIEAVNQNFAALTQGQQSLSEGLQNMAALAKAPRRARRDAAGNLYSELVQ